MPTHIAIGDIHGMLNLLDALLARLPQEGHLVFLGDYLDRGPNSCGVINRLIRLARQRPCTFLRGNHEEMALAVLNGARRMKSAWIESGGDATLRSYRWRRIGRKHRLFLRETCYFYETENFLFVHASIPPGLTPAQCVEIDPGQLLWPRFEETDYHWGKLVIHGHTRVAQPVEAPNRINIDTGAGHGGPLTALLLPEREYVSVAP
ncbi:MAG: metallophosphoesterase family protein [Armatimonadota bacterium]|nr:metallophosphoesterase family protein [Armatimonadota bacterium]